MPNWVYNEVEIKGDEKNLTELKDLLARKHFMTDGTADESVFNFANLISIPEEKLEEYKGTKGFVNGEEVGNTEYNWYHWNNSNWDTKWNAVEAHLEESSDSLIYNFNTAWSQPYKIIVALADLCGEMGLKFNWRYDEEQGWGGEYSSENGVLFLIDEWSEPESHADHVERGTVDNCLCSWADEDKWYADCVRDEVK